MVCPRGRFLIFLCPTKLIAAFTIPWITPILQVAETARVRDVAAMVAKLTGVEVQMVENPRNEASENDLDVANRKFQVGQIAFCPLPAHKNHGCQPRLCGFERLLHLSHQMLGLEPTLLESSAGLLAEVTEIAEKYQVNAGVGSYPKRLICSVY